MRYILAIFLPPFALLACKRPVQFVVNLCFWLLSLPLLFLGFGVFIWLFCSLHALIVCRTCWAKQQMDRLVSAIDARNQSETKTQPSQS
jgi:hypothetical protein